MAVLSDAMDSVLGVELDNDRQLKAWRAGAAPMSAVGATPPTANTPCQTHLRGLAAHLAYGLGIATVTESIWEVTGERWTTSNRPSTQHRKNR